MGNLRDERRGHLVIDPRLAQVCAGGVHRGPHGVLLGIVDSGAAHHAVGFSTCVVRQVVFVLHGTAGVLKGDFANVSLFMQSQR